MQETKCSTGNIVAVEQIERFLRVRDWERSGVNPLGEVEYTKGRDEWQVQISPDGWWSLNKFTDSDVPNEAYKGGFEAVGRYESLDEGMGVKALEAAMVSVGAMEWECPYCGETGGDPVTSYSREWQGDEYHGGIVEWSEEMCTKCSRKMASEGY